MQSSGFPGTLHTLRVQAGSSAAKNTAEFKSRAWRKLLDGEPKEPQVADSVRRVSLARLIQTMVWSPNLESASILSFLHVQMCLYMYIYIYIYHAGARPKRRKRARTVVRGPYSGP